MALTKVTKELIQGSLSVDWQSAVKTSSFQSITGQGYFVNTTASAVTVTMPATASVGDIVSIVDYAGTAQTNNITITAQSNINGSANDVVIDYQRGAVSIIYSGTIQGWVAEFAANDGTDALVTPPTPLVVDYLVVAGGGGGGGDRGGGGGAGGLLTNFGGTGLSLSLSTPYSVTVGAFGGGGSSNGSNGLDSAFTSSFISFGGGGGGGAGGAGNNGGSGGGGWGSSGSSSTNGGGGGQLGQGNDGGKGGEGGSRTGGGGGGAGGVGDRGPSQANGNGGLGLEVNIIGGTGNFYAGGGGGAGTSTPGTGGSGVGGAGGSSSNGNNGTQYTGSGGGGGFDNGYNGGSGGSGVVIVRYPSNYTAQLSNGATGSVDQPITGGTHEYAQINSSGTITFT